MDLKESIEKDFYDEDVDIDLKIDEAAEAIMAKLDPEAMREKIVEQLKNEEHNKASSLLGERYTEKDVSKMTDREKGVAFAKAVIQSDITTIKSLSEGDVTAGGYLVPEQFAAMIIRDLEDGETILKETSTIAMTTDVLKIPGLVDGPRVYWTEEKAAKTTTTATFTEHTLTAYKCAAINALKSRTMPRGIVKKMVNCWDTLTRAISIQARPVMV